MAHTKVQLPDYEETLLKNARRVLLEAGVPPDQVDMEWERLRQLPFPFELPTDEELDEITRQRTAARSGSDL